MIKTTVASTTPRPIPALAPVPRVFEAAAVDTRGGAADWDAVVDSNEVVFSMKRADFNVVEVGNEDVVFIEEVLGGSGKVSDRAALIDVAAVGREDLGGKEGTEVDTGIK